MRSQLLLSMDKIVCITGENLAHYERIIGQKCQRVVVENLKYYINHATRQYIGYA